MSPLITLAAEGGGSASAPLGEHDVLVFLLQLALLVGFARTLGGVMKMFGQPAVVGELLAGVILGPSVFGRLLPDAHAWVFGEATVQSVVFGLAWLGVIMLLIVIGYETDLAIIARFRRAAVAVAAGGFLVPVAAVYLVAPLLPESFIGESASRGVFAGFLALALAVSALPVVAKILQDLGFLRRNFGQITLAAGMTIDAVGWLGLAAMSGVAQDGFQPARLATSFGGLLVFVVLVVSVGRWLLDRIMRTVLRHGSSVTAALTVTLVAALIGGVVTQALALEAILGAFIVGILLATLRHQVPQVESVVETTTAAFFAPVFFAFSGLRVDLGLLNSLEAFGWALGLLALAVVAKLVGTAIGARTVGIRGRESLALGSGLSALGAMGIVVAIVGLNLGVLSETGYTVAVMVAIVTSLGAPVLLKSVVRGWEVPSEEKERLEREEIVAASVVLGSRRILLPTRGGRNSRYAARIVSDVWDDPEVAVLAVDVTKSWWQRVSHRVRAGTADPTDVVAELRDNHRMVKRVAADPADAIAAESRLGYDLVLLGATEEEQEGPGVFSTVVDRVLAGIDIPALVVRFPGGRDEAPEERPRRILAPIVASRASRAAEEIAYSLARHTEGRVTALHVVTRLEGQGVMLEDSAEARAVRAGQEMVLAAAAFGERLGVTVEPAVRMAGDPVAEILSYIDEQGFDLVVLGASNRPLTDRPFLGHRVNAIVEQAPVPVAVVTLPAPLENSGH